MRGNHHMLDIEGSVVVGERRRANRVKMFLTVMCRSKMHVMPFQIMTENMSAVGMKFISHIDLNIDEVLTMHITLQAPFPLLAVRGRVVWCQKKPGSEKPVFEGGVEFTKISEGDRKMLEWFLERY
jgi:hypothetical protein